MILGLGGSPKSCWAASLKLSLSFPPWTLEPVSTHLQHPTGSRPKSCQWGWVKRAAGWDTSGGTDGPFDGSPPLRRTQWEECSIYIRWVCLRGHAGSGSRAPLGGAGVGPLRTGGWRPQAESETRGVEEFKLARGSGGGVDWPPSPPLASPSQSLTVRGQNQSCFPRWACLNFSRCPAAFPLLHPLAPLLFPVPPGSLTLCEVSVRQRRHLETGDNKVTYLPGWSGSFEADP